MAAPNLSSVDINKIIEAISCAIAARPNNELSTEPSVSGTLTAHSSSQAATGRFERINGDGGGQFRRSYSRGGFSCGPRDSDEPPAVDLSSRNQLSRTLRAGQG